MNNSNKYWNYATIAAILIGICNVIPSYLDAVISTTFFSNIGFIWRIVTSYLILFYVGRKYRTEVINPAEGFSYGRSFNWCYLSCMLGGIIEGFLTILYAKVLVPDYLDKVKNMVMNIVSETPSYTPEMVNTVEASLNNILTPFGLLLSAILSAIFGGLVMSLIVAAVLKKAPDMTIDSDMTKDLDTTNDSDSNVEEK